MKKNNAIAAAIFLALSCMAFVPVAGGTADAAAFSEPLVMTDYGGYTHTFTEPAQKAASLGVTFTTTLMELGCVDSIVLMDSNSNPSVSGIDGLGSFNPNKFLSTSTEADVIGQRLINGEDGFDKDRDVVFIYNYSSTALNLLRNTYGLKVVSFYPQSYETGKNMVEQMGAIMGKSAKAAELIGSMDDAAHYYTDALTAAGITEKAKAVYVSYSSNNLRVGNVNSYSVVLLKLAGGVNPADDTTKTGSALTSYAPDDGLFIQMDIDVIFMDAYAPLTPEEFRTAMNISDNVKIYKLSVVMNQYGPTSLQGIEFMAKAMYPDVFGNDAGDGLDSMDQDDTWIYIAAGAAAIGICAVAYVLFFRR